MRLYLLLHAEKVVIASDALHATSGLPMLECAISFLAENRIINFSRTDIKRQDTKTLKM